MLTSLLLPAHQGWRVYAGVRRIADGQHVAAGRPSITPVTLDVTQSDSIQAARQLVEAERGQQGLQVTGWSGIPPPHPSGCLLLLQNGAGSPHQYSLRALHAAGSLHGHMEGVFALQQCRHQQHQQPQHPAAAPHATLVSLRATPCLTGSGQQRRQGRAGASGAHAT
jgi:hypothetical protein